MNYNIKELIENLEAKVVKLGISPKFRDNPAFASALLQIKSLMHKGSTNESNKEVLVDESENQISFSWKDQYGDKYIFNISSSSPETFECTSIVEKAPYHGKDGQIINEVEGLKESATINEQTGEITLTTRGSSINNADTTNNINDNYNWIEKRKYTSGGVMSEKEYKKFSIGAIHYDISDISRNPQNLFIIDLTKLQPDERTLLVREKLDTAKVIYEDASKGIKYIATTPLNQEHGLRDMIFQGPAQEVIIPPLNKDEIEKMIQRETNQKVAEELRKYAIGRESYSYDSSEDIRFKCEGISQSKSISK